MASGTGGAAALDEGLEAVDSLRVSNVLERAREFALRDTRHAGIPNDLLHPIDCKSVSRQPGRE
jgi:hypothetical protein